MHIKYYGHSCFTAQSGEFIIGFDPYDPSVPGYGPLHIEVDEIYCSHEHGDHNYLPAVSIRRGSSEKANPFEISSFITAHDDAEGKLRGFNTVRICLAEGKKIAHLGDIGCMPGESEMEKLKGCDVMMIPVGGYYTIDYNTACEIIKITAPKCAIPMHYRNGKKGFGVLGDINKMKFTQEFRQMAVGEEIEI